MKGSMQRARLYPKFGESSKLQEARNHTFVPGKKVVIGLGDEGRGERTKRGRIFLPGSRKGQERVYTLQRGEGRLPKSEEKTAAAKERPSNEGGTLDCPV